MLTGTQKNDLKNSSRMMESKGIALALSRGEQVIAATYDFSVDGGAVGDVALSYTFPEAMIVTKVLAHEITALTSGGSATVTVEAGLTALSGALAFDTGFTGLDTIALAGSADAIAVESGDVLNLAIGTAALTAGKVRFYIHALPQRDM